MLPVFAVAFREFLEAFLSIGVLMGISAKFNLHRTKGIIGGSIIAFFLVFILATVVFGADSAILKHLPKESLYLIEGWLYTLSGLFIAYAVFSLHKILAQYSQEDIKNTEKKAIEYKTSNWLLPFTAFLLVLKEGCEGIFFNVTNGLFYSFTQDITGIGLAFLVALLCGLLLQKFLNLISLKRIFRITEVFIILVGINAITEGLETLSTYYFNIDISNYDMVIALLYVIFVYEVFIRDGKKPDPAVTSIKEEFLLIKNKRK